MRAAQKGRSAKQRNALQVRLELQADCFAGIWAHDAQRSRSILEAGDLEEALNAAQAIGDDMLQRQTTGTVMPDSFTHGTSAQRQRWFKIGFESGLLKNCDTFAARQL
jgi:predicted metalloprotease